jgi:capsular exopolysaccharide synthesis family protein
MLIRRDPDIVMHRTDGVPESITYYEHPEVQPIGTGDEAWDLRRHLHALWGRRGLIAIVTSAAVLVACGYLLIAEPVYEARAKLLIDAQSPNVVSFQEVIEQNTAKLDYYETQVGILRSRSLAATIIDQLDLWHDPEFTDDRIRQRTSAGTTGTSAPSAVEQREARSHVVDRFIEHLAISYRAGNRLFDVAFRSTDPQLAATVANTVAKVYISQNLERRVRAVKEASEWLNARLIEQRQQVEASELALQRYREQNADVSLSEQQNVIVRKLAELSTAATTARTERIEAESLYAECRKVRGKPEMADALPILLGNPFVQQLKEERASLQRDLASLSERLGDRHPDVIRVQSTLTRVEAQLETEIDRVVESVGNQVQTLRAKEQRLGEAVGAQERLALALDRRAIQYSALQREVTSNRQIFEALLDRAKQTEISSELKVTNVQIVDRAEVPVTPAAPQKKLVLLLALLIGLPIAMGAAVVLEYFDDRIKSPDEIRATLGLKVLGFAPTIPRRVMRQTAGLLTSGLSAEYAEALRTIRANLLLHAPPQAGANALLVTSTRPGEGKTIVAANLAIGLAQAGRRVLLFDADMRRCSVHELFHQPLEPGLAAVLNGTTRIGDAIRPSGVPGLFLLTAGSAASTAGDLLERPAFADVMKALGDQFDWILIDSPPVMVASDATLLAQSAGAVVFVVGSHMTKARLARAALEQLDGAQSKIVGAVLSRSRLERFDYYGHRDHPAYVRN